MRTKLVVTILVVVLVSFAWFVWPTRYRYDRLRESGLDTPVRIDRFSGRTEALVVERGWFLLKRSEETTSKAGLPAELPASELTRLDGRCAIDDINWINCDIYNGSDWTVNDVTLALELRESGFTITDPDGKNAVAVDGAPISRNYRLTKELYASGSPQESSSFHAALGLDMKSQKWTWRIVSAQGHK